MFIGHFGLAFAAKKAAPAASLGTLFLACQLADLLWPTFLLFGIERVEIEPGNTVMTPLAFVSYPYSHSLAALVVWGVLLAVVWSRFGQAGRLRVGIALAVLVVSHWPLDVLTHRPDMPLTLTGATRVGLGLWNSRPGTLGVECMVFGAGVAVYATNTVARDRLGALGFWALTGFLLLVYIANIYGPPPPSAMAVAWAAQALWLLVLWAYRLERHRAVAPVLEGAGTAG